ncbi:DUF6879 family protein [Streptomyces nondiastaticus]|uniref:DUF6879 family protein n=1 Tax=Streptomyces nondiastaticus TaxID=3154512 RepID=A0ABW6TYY0_9ACTN
MPEFIDDATFGDYFRDFRYTAWRLETRRGYASDRAGKRYAQFLNGERLGIEPSAWSDNIRVQVRQGKRIERVRLVDNPPTQGQLFLLASAVNNIAAGEDIRNMWRGDAEKLGLPAVDFWLFDSCRGLVLHFDDADEYLGSELVEDPTRIAGYCQVRDAAWHHAIRREQFLEQVRSHE